MTELTCEQCRDLGAELALDVLTGHQRALVLAHLEGCRSCRDSISALTVTADRLIELLPDAEPPAGFEHRVMTALVTASPRPRGKWVFVAAGVLAIALGAGGWIVGHATNQVPTETHAQPGQRTVIYAPLTTAEHQVSEQQTGEHQTDQTGNPPTGEHQIGHAYIYPGKPSWIYLSFDTDDKATNDTVHCEVVRRDGSTVRVGTFALTYGNGAWGGPAPIDRETLEAARLVNVNGHTLAIARFASPPKKSGRPTTRPHAQHQRHGHSK